MENIRENNGEMKMNFFEALKIVIDKISGEPAALSALDEAYLMVKWRRREKPCA